MLQAMNLGFGNTNANSATPSGGTPAWGRPLFLLVISLVFTASFIMSIFTPCVLALLLLMHGRLQGTLLILCGATATFFYGTKLLPGSMVFYSYLTSALLAYLIAEVIYRKLHPLRGLMVCGSILVVVAGLMLGALSLSLPAGLSGELEKKIGEFSSKLKTDEGKNLGLQSEDKKVLLETFANPKELTKDILAGLPFTLFISIFFALWTNLGLLLRGPYLFAAHISYPFTIRDLLHFKTPDVMIWPLIAVLLLMLLEPYVWPNVAMIVGKNLLFCFGVFYFFQGFGIFVELLTLLKIEGIFRSLLIILTVITSYWILALVGLFDMWVDFRKLISKKLDRGDTI
ncbi:MAG: DUF2232 domain-containing protein [Oligoflexia bacterium]|nr:DUF2232 domain-containing protein [Oligoflexia bacterium]MBF0366020.1 DUF2232 domain-containing protein [Oligoflexia bacterium]